MKKERIVTISTLIIGTLITLIKIFSGMIFDSYTLLVLGYFSLINIMIIFIAYFGSVVRGRRVSLNEPFGFGKLENISIMIFGLTISFIWIFIIIKSFFLEYLNTDLRLTFIISIIALIQFLISSLIFKNAKDIQSEMLMDIAHTIYYDATLSFLLIIIVVLSWLFPIFDQFGVLIFSLLILYKGLQILFYNFVLLNGQNDNSKEIFKEAKKIINNQKSITYSNANLVNINNFYKITIELLVGDEISLGDLIFLEKRIRRKVKWDHLNIKMVEFKIFKD